MKVSYSKRFLLSFSSIAAPAIEKVTIAPAMFSSLRHRQKSAHWNSSPSTTWSLWVKRMGGSVEGDGVETFAGSIGTTG